MDDESKLIAAALAEVDSIREPVRAPVDAIPGYTIRSEIHRGAQGVVYHAVQASTGQEVAIKVLRQGPHAGEVDRARFEREVAILAQLRHRNIVSILDTGSSAGCFYFVMDHIRGQALDAWAEESRGDLRAMLRLFQRVCSAVQAAHVRGVIHRDLKPGNILVDEEGEPHILDFGLAKLEADDAPLMTQTGQFVGSIPWSSPEQADSPSHVDVRSDVYALGVILYQMLTGRFPYEVSGNLREVLERICTADPAPLRGSRRAASGSSRGSSSGSGSQAGRGARATGGSIDGELETLVLTCLAKDPDRRYQTAGELGRDIEAWLTGAPLAARRDSTWYLLKKQFQRHRVAAAVAAAFLLVLTAGFVTSLAFWREAERQRALAEEALGLAEANFRGSERLNGFWQEVFETATPVPQDVALAQLDPQELDIEPASPFTVEQLLDRARQLVDVKLEDPTLAADARSTIGRALVRVGRFDTGGEELERALALRRVQLGEEHADTLDTAVELGLSYVYSGDPGRAQAILQPLAGADHARLPDGRRKHFEVQLQSALGSVALAQGRTEEGRRILLGVKGSLEKEIGEPGAHSDEFVSLAIEPALWLSAVGETEAAEDLMLLCRSHSARELGPQHFVTVDSDRVFTRVRALRQHAGTMQFGWSVDAPAGEAPGAAMSTVVIGDDGAGLAGFLEVDDVVELADALPMLDLGSDAQAALALQMMAGMEASLGPDHPRTLSTKGRLAWELRRQPARLGEAERLAREALEATRALHGEDDLDTLINEQTLGVLLHLQGRTDEGAALLEGLADHARRAVPTDGGRRWLFFWTHAVALREADQPERAQQVLREGCEGLLASLGRQHGTTRRALGDLAALSHDLGLGEQESWAREQLAGGPQETRGG